MSARWVAVLAALAASDLGAQAPFAEVVDVETVIAPSGAGYDLFDADHVRTLGDGRIVVLNVGSAEVLVFSPSGRLERRFGGEGEGPGEIQIRAAFLGVLPNDSILVTDWAQRATVFTPDGTIARTFRFEGPPSGTAYAFPRAVSGGRIIAGQGLEVPTVRPGPVDVPFTTWVYDMEGRVRGTRSHADVADEWMVIESEGRLRTAALPLRRTGLTGSDGNILVLGNTTSRDVRVLGADLQPRATIRVPEPRSRLTPSLVDELRETWVDEASGESARTVRLRAVQEAPAPVDPVIGALEVDRLGRIWAAEANPADDRPTRWHVYANNALLGFVDLPAGLEIREIGADYGLAVQTDDLDVETIIRVRLRVLR